jgi:hypothetical protein
LVAHLAAIAPLWRRVFEIPATTTTTTAKLNLQCDIRFDTYGTPYLCANANTSSFSCVSAGRQIMTLLITLRSDMPDSYVDA